MSKPDVTTNVSIFGVGNFGYAILNHLSHKNLTSLNIKAYDIDNNVINSLSTSRYHPYLHTESKISPNVLVVDNVEDLTKDCNVLILAVSSNVTREVIESLKPYLTKPIIIVNTAKALDYITGKRLSEIVAESLKGFDYKYALLAGGTIAKDLFHNEPLGVDIASYDTSILPGLTALFGSPNLKVYPTDDLTGTEYAAAFKNVISIIAGLTKGLGFSYGSETHIISITAQQIADVCVEKLGAKPETFYVGRQVWGNDLWMSCTGNTRNREFGVLVGKLMSVEKAIESMAKSNSTVEGINTLKTLNNIAGIKDIPIISLLYSLLIDKSEDIHVFKSHLLGAVNKN